jgi:hypothetical protein
MRCCMSATVMVLLFWSESEFCSDSGSSLYGFPCRSGVLYDIGIGSGCSRAVPWEPAYSNRSSEPGQHMLLLRHRCHGSCTFQHPCAGFIAAVKCHIKELI